MDWWTAPSRRQMLRGGASALGVLILEHRRQSVAAQALDPLFSYPIGLAGRVLGDGCFVRDGFTVENTWYLPGYWHTGEDWYLLDGDSDGTGVYAIADGEVVYRGGNYPGLVVIVRHEDELFSMYGHLDFGTKVEEGDRVERGERIGEVLARTDEVPSHLHFEVRTFVETDEVNGVAPRYGFGCGVDCPPGPGYWPIDAPELPVEMGWRNPTHVIAGRAYLDGVPEGASIVVASVPSRDVAVVWSSPGEVERDQIDELALEPGSSFGLRAVSAGVEAPDGTGADSYQVWYEIEIGENGFGWVQGVVPSEFEVGSDGRPASVRFDLLLDVRVQE
jgi:hypothetical protein